MPELPEVETLCQQMSSVLTGAEVYCLDILDARLGRGRKVKGKRVKAIVRQGKEVMIRLNEGSVIRLHLRMTGRLLWQGACREMLPHIRLVIIFDRGRLVLIDPRRFATLSFDEPPDCPAPVRNPLENCNAEVLIECAAERTLPVKSFLLDQGMIAGIGNIYVCEILHAAAVHPRRGTESLSRSEWRNVARAAEKILAKAVDCRGTSVSDWRDLFGREGEYQNHLRVYGRAGKICSRCQGTIVRESLGGRGTFFCPACQR